MTGRVEPTIMLQRPGATYRGMLPCTCGRRHEVRMWLQRNGGASGVMRGSWNAPVAMPCQDGRGRIEATVTAPHGYLAVFDVGDHAASAMPDGKGSARAGAGTGSHP